MEQWPVVWPLCHPRIRVDINKKTFNKSPHKSCWIAAIEQNAVGGWNDVYRNLFHEDLFYLVPGNNGEYDVQFNYLGMTAYRALACGQYGCADPEAKPGNSPCCGDYVELTRVIIYYPDLNNWQCGDCGTQGGPSLRRAAVHELGHAILLKDHDQLLPWGGPDSVMNYAKCFTWPSGDDGRGVLCSYHPIRYCACNY